MISKTKEEALNHRMRALGIREGDIVEKFIRSGGRGGQKRNKTSTCVYLKHIPTGIEIKCSAERSQAINRFLARRILAGKIEVMVQGRRSAQQQMIEKIRRQKRKRSKRAKEKMLETKQVRSLKKQLRSFRPEID